MGAWLRKTAAGLRWLLAGVILCGLAGCFDYEIDLDLRSDGGGTITARYILDAARVGDRPVEEVLPPGRRTIADPDPGLKRLTRGGKVIYQEQAFFASLDKLGSRLIWFKAELLDIGLIVKDQPTYRITAFMADPDRSVQPDRSAALGARHQEREAAPPPDDPVERKIRALRQRAQQAHYFELTLKVPGRLKDARSLVVGSYKSVPRVAADRASVSWRIPMAVMDNESPGYALEFSAVFKGAFAIRSRMGDISRRLEPGQEGKAGEKGKEGGEGAKGMPGKEGPR